MKFQHYLSALLLFTLTLVPSSAQNEPSPSPSLSSHDTLVRDAEAGDAYSARQLYMRYAAANKMQSAKQWADKYAEILKQQAQAGQSQAMLRLGAAYLDGRDMFPLDREQSLLWFSKASASGEPSGAYILAELYKADGHRELAQEHYARAYELYSEQLTQNKQDSNALYWLGMMQLDGLGTKQAIDAGIAQLEASAELGNKWAYTQLFKFFAEGAIITRDEKRALTYAQKMADDFQDGLMAYALACAYLNGQSVSVDEAKGMHYLEQACKANIADAIALKGSRLEQSGQREEALLCYRQAASMGQEHALTRLGTLTLKGEGTEKDEEQGVALLTTASERFQSKQAPLELAYYYEAADESSLADYWYVVASDRGVAQAMARRGLLHLNTNSDLDWNPTLTYRWWKMGSEAGDATCSKYINLFLFAFIPFVLIVCFLGPVLLIHYLNKRAVKKAKSSD